MEEMDKHSNRGEQADVESNSSILELNWSIHNEGRPTSSPLETKDSTLITTEEICSVTDRALEMSLSNANGEKEDEKIFLRLFACSFLSRIIQTKSGLKYPWTR